MKKYVNHLDASVEDFDIENIVVFKNTLTIINDESAISFLAKPDKTAVVVYFFTIENGDRYLEQRLGMDYEVFKDEVMEMIDYRIETENKQEWRILKNEIEELL